MNLKWFSQLTNKTNGTAQNKETIEYTNVDVFLSLFTSKTTTVAQKIDHRKSDNTIDV